MFDRFIERRFLIRRGDNVRLTAVGQKFFARSDLGLIALDHTRRPLCRPCLDRSERRSHLSDTLGAAIFERIFDRGWATREKGTRVVRFSADGQRKMTAQGTNHARVNNSGKPCRVAFILIDGKTPPAWSQGWKK
jgi:hypothetical protein